MQMFSKQLTIHHSTLHYYGVVVVAAVVGIQDAGRGSLRADRNNLGCDRLDNTSRCPDDGHSHHHNGHLAVGLT